MPLTLTDEQNDIADAFEDEEDLVIKAAAGVGKTTTLRELGKIDYGRDGLYVTYSKASAKDASKKFPKHVTCKTAHALAYAFVGNKYKERLEGPRLPSRVVADKLGVTESFYVDGHPVSRISIARLANEAVSNFAHSADDELTHTHVETIPFLGPDSNEGLRHTVLKYAKVIWSDLQSLNGEFKFEHDHYLKIWGLRHPQLHQYDYVMFDEAQDADPVIAKIINEQMIQRVMVGDANQAIYGWRGAIDALSQFTGKPFTLTQSFRFGPAIAEEANKWLTYLDADLRVRGLESINSRIEALEEPKAILCRTNFGAVFECIDWQKAGQKVALVGGGQDILNLAYAADDLKNERRTDHPQLFMFNDWNELRDYTQEDKSGSDLAVFVKLVDSIGVAGIKRVVHNLVEESHADLIVSTAHKAKGREWLTVQIGNDFETPDEIGISREEARLCYVAVTRARSILDQRTIDWIRYLTPDMLLMLEAGT